MFDDRAAIRTVIETYDITFRIVCAGYGKCAVHCLLGGFEGRGLGESAMVFEVFLAATR